MQLKATMLERFALLEQTLFYPSKNKLACGGPTESVSQRPINLGPKHWPEAAEGKNLIAKVTWLR